MSARRGEPPAGDVGPGVPGIDRHTTASSSAAPRGWSRRLEQIARACPAFVYLAPYPDMDVEIAVTRLGTIFTLDDVDRERIVAFINE